MSGPRFDRLVQVVDKSSRRLAVRSALAGVSIAAAAYLSPGGESQAKKKKKKKCKTTPCPICPPEKECPTCQGLANGEACSRTTECCGTETNMVCAKKDIMKFGTVCCGTTGAPCDFDSDCCYLFICGSDGYCFTI